MTSATKDFSELSRFVPLFNNPQQILYNNSPVSDFLGLTPSEMHALIFDPFGEDSDFKILQVDDSTLDQVPFFLLAEHLLLMIYRDSFATLTPKGCLSTKYCSELLEKKLLKELIFESQIRKRALEKYFPSIEAVRLILRICKLVTKKNNKIQLSKYALLLLQENRRFEIFKMIFQTYSHTFSWAYLDGYSSDLVGQLGFAFSITLLKHYGEYTQKISFYLDKYKKAFPQLESQFKDFPYFPSERQYISCYRSRLFERLFEWFGLARQDNPHDIMNPGNNMYSKTIIFDKLFKTPEISSNFN